MAGVREREKVIEQIRDRERERENKYPDKEILCMRGRERESKCVFKSTSARK